MTDSQKNRKLTDAQRAERNAGIIADAPTMTIREMEKKYDASFGCIMLVLRAAGVRAKSGKLSRKGEKKNWQARQVRDPNATHLTCTRCSETKPVCDFYEKRMVCRACNAKRAEEWAEKNPEAANANKAKYREANKETLNTNNKVRYRANIDEERARSRTFYRRHRIRLMKKSSDYQKRRLKTDVKFRLRVTLRERIWRLLKGVGGKRGSKTEVLIGMKYADFLKHIESLWLPGMTWANYGHRGWHIDHIIPCALFDLRDMGQRLKCFHYSNMRPLWALDNLRKGKKIIVDCHNARSMSAVAPDGKTAG